MKAGENGALRATACTQRGEVTERPKVHDWKSCVVQATGGSNPPLSATIMGGRAGYPGAPLPDKKEIDSTW